MRGGSRHASATDAGRAGERRGSERRADEGRIADAIRPVVTASGMDLESVRVTAAGRRRLLRVVVDSDHGVSLDAAAAVSRDLSAVLEAADVMGDFPYTLEVSSPGVDRPLTEPRHWRRAAGRLVKVRVADVGAPAAGRGKSDTAAAGPGKSNTVLGRVVSADAAEVVLDVEGARRHFTYVELGPGAVQVEFGRLPEQPKEPPLPEAQVNPVEHAKQPETRDGH